MLELVRKERSDAEAVDSLSVTHRCKCKCRLESKQCHYKVPL